MVEITILSENPIVDYVSPDQQVRKQLIMYQVEGWALRQVRIDTDKLPDVVFRQKNPGKAVPASVQAEGDKMRRATIEAEIAKLTACPGPRRI